MVIFSLAGILSGSNRAVRTFLGLADDRFGFQVLLQSEDPAFPTDPRLFEPTERSKRIVTYCVDQDAAGGEFARHTGGPFRVRRAYVGDEAEFGVIGDFNGLGFRLVRQYRQYRSENFFLRDTHHAGDVGEHGGLDEIPTFKSLGMTFAADDELRAFLDPRLDVLLHALVLLCAGQWAEGDVLVPRIAHFYFFDGRLGQPLHFVEAVFRHDQTRGRNAGLPVIQVAGVGGHRGRQGEIGVVQDDVGRLAPEFQRQALHCAQGVLGDQFSDLRRAGESDFPNLWTLR